VRGEALLVEGYVDGLVVAATGKSVVVVGGTGISAAQAAEIRDLNLSRITILPDNDGEGAEAARNWGRQFFPATRIAPPDYGGEHYKDIADLFAAVGPEGTTEQLDRLVDSAKDPIDLETEVTAEIEGGPREKLAYATEHIVPLLAQIHPAGMQDATAEIVADRVDGLMKNWLTKTIKDEMERLEGEMVADMMRQAEEAKERMRAEHQARVEKAQPEIDELFEPGVLKRLRDAAAKVHHVERDERELEMAILIALGAQLAPLPNGRPSGASALLTADAARGKNHTLPTPRSSYSQRNSTRPSRSSRARRSTTGLRTTLTSSDTHLSTRTRSRASRPSSSSCGQCSLRVTARSTLPTRIPLPGATSCGP